MLPGSKKRPDGKLGSEVWTEYVKDELRSIQPHLVVVDMLTCSGFDAADALKIPVIVNCPGPLNMFGLMGKVVLTKRNTSTCCGFLCVRQTIKEGIANKAIKFFFANPNMTRNLRTMCSRNLVISNSFWGLEEAMPVPPNMILTGPLSKRDSQGLL